MDILSMHAQSQPDKAAVVVDDLTITYGQLEEDANRFANALLTLGITRGDRCTTVGYNAPQHFITSSANRKIEAVGVPMNYRLTGPEMEYQLNDSGSAAVFCGPDQLETVASVAGRCPELRVKVAWGVDAVPDGWLSFDEVLQGGSPEHPGMDTGMTGASMTYTAGTTGNPKGAYRAQGTDPAVLFTYIQLLQMSPEDRHLIAGPLYHSAPAALAVINTALGATNVLMRRFDPQRALETIERQRCTTTFMAPTLLQRIVDLPDEVRARYDLSSMRVIVVAAAPCPHDVKVRVHELFGEVLYEFYGSSEAGINTILYPHEQLERPGSCGRVCEGNEIRILDDLGHPVPQGEPGEIWIRSNSLITEYYGKPEATAESMRDGFFSVGDIGYFDEDGYLYVVDRKRDMIISGGANIYSAEVENAIHGHPGVADVAVIGIPSEEWGETVHAIVQPVEGESLTEPELRAWLADRLAQYKHPKSYEFRELPRDLAGKIRKRELREPFWAGRETKV
ncbi:MAG TPA: AMP-binding protein [Actinomycetota bacterium]|nr:AMP-binding protein [Actinomycetota bacterium]